MAITFTTDFLTRMDPQMQNSIIDAQIADLMDRRDVRDTALFIHCFNEAIPADDTDNENVYIIEHFSEIAQAAFSIYHYLRKRWATVVDGKVVYATDGADEAAADGV